MKSSLQKLVLLALISALNVAVARIFLIPVPFTNGNLNLCDAGIVLAALLYGRRAGATVGALSGLLLDLLGDPTDPIFPHRGIVYIAFFGNYFGPDNDNTLTVSMWRQF